MNERRNDLEIMNWYPQIALQIQTRIDLLFTMSDIPHVHPVKDDMQSDVFADDNISRFDSFDVPFHLVEPDGIEPTTSCLQSTRSPS